MNNLRSSFTFLFSLGFSSLLAQSGFDKSDYDSYFELANYLTSSSEINHLITESCAVFVRPTPEKIEQLKAEHGEADFYTIADDNIWYEYQASEMLRSLNIKIAHLESGTIKFLGAMQPWVIDTDKPEAPAWNLILFNVGKPPLIGSMGDLSEQALKDYFELN